MLDAEMEKYWDEMVETGIATDEELGLACALCGYNIETFKQVLFIRTGYRDLEQMMDEEY